MVLKLLLLYMLLLTLVSFWQCGHDKRCAKKGKQRIPEKTLLCTAALGGCFGLLAGMLLFRHKTRHRKFTVLTPFLCAAWLSLLVYACYLTDTKVALHL